MDRISSGSEAIDKLLNGGYEKDIITTIYGPAGSGKTTMCLMASISAAAKKKVIYIDTESGFSAERIKQLEGYKDELMKKIMILKPTDFAEQHKMFKNYQEMVNDKIGLVVVDTISMLYRVERSRTKDRFDVNQDLQMQIHMLSDISRKKNIPVLLTNQVYSDFEKKEGVKMVGGDILSYSSKCLMELEKLKSGRKIIVKKHRSIPEDKNIVIKIEEKGFTLQQSHQE